MSASGDKFACTSCGATFVTPWPNCPICNAAMAAVAEGAGGPAPSSSGLGGGGQARLNLNFNFPGGPGGPDASQEPQLFASAPASPSATPYQHPTTTGTSRLDEIFQSSPDAGAKPNFASFTFGGTPVGGGGPATPAKPASGSPASGSPASPAAGGPGAGSGLAGGSGPAAGGGFGGPSSAFGGGKPAFGGGAAEPAPSPTVKPTFGADDPFKGPVTPGGRKPEFKPMNFGGGSPGAAAPPSPTPTPAPAPAADPFKPKPKAFEPPKPLSPRPTPPAKPPVDDALARSLALLDSLESSKVSAILPSQAYLASRPAPSNPVQASAPGGSEGGTQGTPAEPAPSAEQGASTETPGAFKSQFAARPPMRPIASVPSRPGADHRAGSDHALSSMNRIWPPKDGEEEVDPHADSLPSEEDFTPPQEEEEEKKGGIGAVLGVLAAVVVFLAFTATALVYGLYNLAGLTPAPPAATTDVGTLAAASNAATSAAVAETSAPLPTKTAPLPTAASTTASPSASGVSTSSPVPSGTGRPSGTGTPSGTGNPSGASTPAGSGSASPTSGGGSTTVAAGSGRPAGTGGSGSIRQQIWEAMESDIPEVAAAASKKIAAEQGKSAVPKLVDMLKNSNKFGRTWAARTLTQFGPDSVDAAEALAKNLPRGGEETAASVEALTAIGPPSLPLVLGLLRNPDPVRPVETQLAALAVIQNVGPKGTLLVSPAVLPFLESTNPDLRETSKETLKKLGPASMTVGADAFREGSAAMRKSLCEVWASYGPEAKSALPQLGEVLKSNDEELFRHAAHTLFKIGPASLPTLFDVLENAKSRKARDEASKAVGWIGEPAVKPTLDQLDAWIRSGKSAYDDPVGYLLSSLGRMGAAGKAALPKLAEWSRHPNGNISFYARDSLDKIQRAKP